jgi:hypothetical protein
LQLSYFELSRTVLPFVPLFPFVTSVTFVTRWIPKLPEFFRSAHHNLVRTQNGFRNYQTKHGFSSFLCSPLGFFFLSNEEKVQIGATHPGVVVFTAP